MADVTRLLTFVDVDDRDARGLSVSALHQAVLDDGRRVVLLNDRGWTSSRGAAADPVSDIEADARAVVGPDEPFGTQSREDAEVLHWEALVSTLREAGVVADVAKLRGLPHDVELSARVLAISEAASVEEPREPGPMANYPTFEPLMVLQGGPGKGHSNLILGMQFASVEHPLRLVFQHEGHGEPEPLPSGDLHVRYLTLDNGERCIVLCGDNCDEPRADRVVLATPYAVGTICRLRKPRYYRPVWMSFPEPFKPGPVTAWWMAAGSDEIIHKIETPPLAWGTPWPQP